MKRFLFFLLILLMAFGLKAQTITDTASLRNFINTRIVSNGSRMITGSDLNKVFNGIATLMKAYAVDSGYVRNDTLFLTRRGGFTSYGIKLPSGAGGVELDPTVSQLVKSIDAIDTTRWGQKGVTSLYKKGTTDSIFMVYNGDTSFAYKDFRFEGVLTDETLAGYGHTSGAVLRVNTDIIARRDWVLSQGLSKWEYDANGYLVPRSFGGSRLAFPKTLQLKDTLMVDTLKDGTADEYLITYDRSHKIFKKVLKSSIGGGGGGGAVASVFGRTGSVIAQASDYSAFFASLSGSYTNPSWIVSLPWTKVTGAPAFVLQSTFDAAMAETVDIPVGGGLIGITRPGLTDSLTLKNWPATTTALYYFGTDASNNVGLFPLPSGGGGGGGDVASVFGRTGAVTALASDYSAFFASLSGSYTNPSWIASLPWTKITGAPSFASSTDISNLQDQIDEQQQSADSAFVVKNTGQGKPIAYSVGTAKDTLYIAGVEVIQGSGILVTDNSTREKASFTVALADPAGGSIPETEISAAGTYNVSSGHQDIFVTPGAASATISTALNIRLPQDITNPTEAFEIRIFVGPSDAIDINSWGAAGDTIYSNFVINVFSPTETRIIDQAPPSQAISGDVFIYRRRVVGSKTHWYRIK